jgi:hypothetical protein
MADQYQRDIQSYFHQRKLFRYLVVTFPKTIATLTTGVVVALSYFTYDLIRKDSSRAHATTEALHLYDGKTRQSKRIVIYNSTDQPTSSSSSTRD